MPIGRCRRCGARQCMGRVLLCPNCMATLMAARAAVQALIAERYVEDLGGGAYVFRQGAQELAELLGGTDPALFRTEG